MTDFLTEIALDIEKIDFKYEYNLKLLDIEMDYTTEFVGSEAIKKLKKGIKYLINLTYLSIEELKKINDNQAEKLSIGKTIKVYELITKKYPDLSKEKVYIRAYKDLKDNDKDYDKKIDHNLLVNVRELLNNPRNAYLLMNYNIDKATDGYYEIPLEDAVTQLKTYYDNLIKETEEYKNDLKTLSRDIDKVMSIDVDIFSGIKKLLMNVKEAVIRRTYIFYMNLDLLSYQIKHITEKHVENKAEEVVINIDSKEDIDKVKKSSEQVGTMQVGELTFNIYKTKYNNISCFNLGGHDIFVTNKFFNLPKGYQLAILYHEIGHTTSGHFFPLEIQDDAERLKIIKKDKKKFDRLVYNSRYYNVENLINNEELLYILTELDADRYSANKIGKRLMKSSLKSTFNEMLKNSDLSKDLVKYNKFRMSLRTKMI